MINAGYTVRRTDPQLPGRHSAARRAGRLSLRERTGAGPIVVGVETGVTRVVCAATTSPLAVDLVAD